MNGAAVQPGVETVTPGGQPPPLRTRYGGAAAALVVEGDRAFAAELAAALGRRGIRADTAHDGLEALYALDHETPDLIVLDLDAPPAEAPVLSGRRLAHLLGQDDVTRPLPLLVLSSLSFPEVAEALRGNADDFLEKPVPSGEVAERARQLLEQATERQDALLRRAGSRRAPA